METESSKLRAQSSKLNINVSCYAGHRGEETPREMTIGGRRVIVAEILDRWLAPDHRYFKLRGDDGDEYIIRQDVASQEWELTMFKKALSSEL